MTRSIFQPLSRQPAGANAYIVVFNSRSLSSPAETLRTRRLFELNCAVIRPRDLIPLERESTPRDIAHRKKKRREPREELARSRAHSHTHRDRNKRAFHTQGTPQRTTKAPISIELLCLPHPKAACFLFHPVAPIEITSQPESSFAERGKAFVLQCSANSTIPVAWVWLKEGISVSSQYATISLGNLIFNPFVYNKNYREDVGSYQCVASNRYGSVMSQAALVQVAGKTNRT